MATEPHQYVKLASRVVVGCRLSVDVVWDAVECCV